MKCTRVADHAFPDGKSLSRNRVISVVRCHMQLRISFVFLGVIAFAATSSDCHDATAQQQVPQNEKAEPLVPDRESRRGDYDIQHHTVKRNDLLQIKMRGIYKVVGVEESHLLLKPLPDQKGLLNGVWKIPCGRSHIGNHHKIVVADLNAKDQTATLALEYKERWHWWDINF